MKTFICALIVLCVLTVAVAANAVYVHNSAEELTAMLSALPEDPATADTAPVQKMWREREPILCLTVSHKETDEIADGLSELASRRDAADAPGYQSARQKLLDLAERLSKSEGLSWGSIF